MKFASAPGAVCPPFSAADLAATHDVDRAAKAGTVESITVSV